MDLLSTVGAVIEDSYISAGIVDLNSRKVLQESVRRKRVNPLGSADAILESWAAVLSEVLALLPSSEKKIGIGIPGPADYASGIYLNSEERRYGKLFQVNVINELSTRLNSFSPQIRLINDAASFFQGEVFGGAARGYKKSFGITLGVGLGSARYVNGEVEDADYWHKSFKDKRAEDFLSLQWIVNRFKELTGIEVADLIEMKRFSPDPRVDAVFNEFATNLGDLILEIYKKEQPEMILIGGHMESSNRFFFQQTIDYVKERGLNIPIMKAILGERAGIIGAASVWYDRELLLHS
jgi:glucokinase